MKFIKATIKSNDFHDGKTEIFNTDKIMTICAHGDGVKILMGAGMSWLVYRDSIEVIDCTNDLIEEIKNI